MPVFAPLKRTELSGELTGPLASLRLVQTYSYTKEQCPKVLEARYRFPLPGDSAVTGVRVTFGSTEIATELKDRQSAKDDYKDAKRDGKQAVMVTRESPDVFTICIAGIVPDEDVRIETTYVQLARPEGRGWSVRIPLTTPPRYVRKDEFSSRHAGGQPLMVLRDPGHRFAMDVMIDGADSVESPTHRLKVSATGDRIRVQLQQGEVLPDRDCVLRWALKQEKDLPALSARVLQAGDESYFMAMIAPPASKDVRKAPRESIILVDHSGSMEGPKWEAADWAVEKFLLGMGKGDTFALGVFHNDTKWYSSKLAEATTENVRSAIAFLKSHKESGGTELGMALEQALDIRKIKGDAARHVLIVTDAEVSDEGRILRLASDESKLKDRRRISILCIDAAPNSFLAMQLAEKGGGVARFLTSSPEEGDISTALDSILEDWQQPVIAGCRLVVSGGTVDSDRTVTSENGRHYIDMGDLPAGRSLWVSGRAATAGKVKFGLTGSDGREIASCEGEPYPSSSLLSLFGARKIIGLEFLIHSRRSGEELKEELKVLSYDPGEVLKGRKSKLYPENNQVNETESIRNLIVSESVKYGIASSETAFVAISTVAGKKVEYTAIVANALADGWSEDFLSKVNYSSAAPPASMPSPSLKPMKSMNRSKRSMVPSQEVIDLVEDQSCEMSESEPVSVKLPSRIIFEGVPVSSNGEAVLFDSANDGKVLAGAFRLDRLIVEFSDGIPDAPSVGPDAKILIYVDDMAVPRAAVKLADMIRQNGVRPLNISLSAGSVIRVVLAVPAGFKPIACAIKVSMGTQ